MPEYRRVLEPPHRHFHVAGRYLYAPMWLLCRAQGRPLAIDWDEPRRVAEAVATLGLKHAVITSVNRDDDNIGGARIFAETIREVRRVAPECRVEVLIPDFQGLDEALRIVLDARPT